MFFKSNTFKRRYCVDIYTKIIHFLTVSRKIMGKGSSQTSHLTIDVKKSPISPNIINGRPVT